MTYTNIPKPSGTTYTNIGKPTGAFTLLAGMATGLTISPTYATTRVLGNTYTNIGKPVAENLGPELVGSWTFGPNWGATIGRPSFTWIPISGAKGSVRTATIVAAGTNYTIGDTLHLTGQGSNANCFIKVVTINGGGGITSLVITATGSNYPEGFTYNSSADTGIGSGATFNIITSTGELYQQIATVSGNTYRMVYRVINDGQTGTTSKIQEGTIVGSATTLATVTTIANEQTLDFVASASNTNIYIYASGTASSISGTLYELSIRQLLSTTAWTNISKPT